MIFVDGENLAIRYGSALKAIGLEPSLGVYYEPNVFVWSKGLSDGLNPGHMTTAVMRKYYYTAVCGDELRVDERGSKQVDISLATDMLVHAMRKHYDVAVLIAGDGDYVPLVRAVQFEGASSFRMA